MCNMNETIFPNRSIEDVLYLVRHDTQATWAKEAEKLVRLVQLDGDAGLQKAIFEYEGRQGGPLLIERDDLRKAYERLPVKTQQLLERTRDRIELFAKAQKAAVRPTRVSIPGGVVGSQWTPVNRVACYAPGGRFPLPSSVLMTVATARAAGVPSVWAVTPSSDDLMWGTAWVAGADGLVHAGGAQAIAAVAYGTETVGQVDLIVGPGNRWVSAAKKIVDGVVGIDMIAGPSELVVAADATADPAWIAADLLAQAEHDDDALPVLLSTSRSLIDAVKGCLETQTQTLRTQKTAQNALRRGGAIFCEDMDTMVQMINQISPEHLSLQGPLIESRREEMTNYGALFIGAMSAEVFGDYGAGPNHVLPTSSSARFSGGLSVYTFLKSNTWMKIERPSEAQEMMTDALQLATLEGLEGHAVSASLRLNATQGGQAVVSLKAFYEGEKTADLPIA